ncbi:histidine phosphatase family protein [Natronoglomus mannanivorans]|uniref:Histidine phosphatase family protein n=1 Tax=Natronoglomus mannanivorans TaxID=2979990 RepID=A0AAP3E1B8_9EURY|nr:histidine phosphatase family protein [Halobacteria archaeon AArc-xg1-1]
MSTVVVVRHGETAWTRDGRVQGWAPVPLTERGRTQARRTGDYLATAFEIDRLVSSDLLRCFETASLVGERLDPAVRFRTDPAWRERDFGLYQGLADRTIDEVLRPRLESDASGPNPAPESGPGPLIENARGESWVDVHRRVLEAWASLVDSLEGETVAIVTHTGPITNLLAEIEGLDPADPAAVPCDVGSVHVVDVDTDAGPRVVRQNVLEHLRR